MSAPMWHCLHLLSSWKTVDSNDWNLKNHWVPSVFSVNCKRNINLILFLFLSFSITSPSLFTHDSVILYFIQQLFTDCLPFARYHAGSEGSVMSRTTNVPVLVGLPNWQERLALHRKLHGGYFLAIQRAALKHKCSMLLEPWGGEWR